MITEEAVDKLFEIEAGPTPRGVYDASHAIELLDTFVRSFVEETVKNAWEPFAAEVYRLHLEVGLDNIDPKIFEVMGGIVASGKNIMSYCNILKDSLGGQP